MMILYSSTELLLLSPTMFRPIAETLFHCRHILAKCSSKYIVEWCLRILKLRRVVLKLCDSSMNP
jgi:hypothetical protein